MPFSRGRSLVERVAAEEALRSLAPVAEAELGATHASTGDSRVQV